MQWFREWEGFVKGKDNGNWTSLAFPPQVMFKSLINRLNVHVCQWFIIKSWFVVNFSQNKCPMSSLYIYMDQRIWQINCFIWDIQILLLPKSCKTVKSWSLVFWFIFKEFALVPRVKFLTCYSKMKCQNIFQFLALVLIFFFFFFCLPCFVLSHLFITAYIWHCCKWLFFLFFFSDFCSSNICFLSVASWGAIISFHSATKTFDILI